jgi:ankyrin repeat protein
MYKYRISSVMSYVLLQDGMTPLMLSSFQGHHIVVSALLHRGADVHIKSKVATVPLFLWSFFTVTVTEYRNACFVCRMDIQL